VHRHSLKPDPKYPQAQSCVAFLRFHRVELKSLIPKPYDFEPTTFGEHVRKRRLILGLTQAEVATQLGVNEYTVGNWENDETKPVLGFLKRVIAFLGYDPEPPKPQTVAEHLKAKRRELGWSQKETARHLGVDPCTWSSWESGGTIMALAHRRLVARFLGLSEAVVYAGMKKRWSDSHQIEV
jgi:transcriptional regulator with XRE-family HTH domain